MIKLSDIAKELGVSTATISNALKGKGRMKEETRRHIRETALAMGYALPQSPQAQEIPILLITEACEVAFTGEIVKGFTAAAQEADLFCPVYNLNILREGLGRDASAAQLRPLVEACLARCPARPACVAYIAQYPRQLPGLLTDLGCPAVAVYCHGTGASATIHYDDQQGAYQAVSHLIESGRRTIAMLSGPVDSHTVSDRMIGYQRALIDHGLTFHPKLVWIGDWEVASGRALTRNLLAASTCPDAIFAQNDAMAVGALQAIGESGLRAPEDVAVMGFDDTIFCTWTQPALTSVAPPFYAMGQAAFASARSLAEGRALDAPLQRLPCRLRLRDSSQ